MSRPRIVTDDDRPSLLATVEVLENALPVLFPLATILVLLVIWLTAPAPGASPPRITLSLRAQQPQPTLLRPN